MEGVGSGNSNRFLLGKKMNQDRSSERKEEKMRPIYKTGLSGWSTGLGRNGRKRMKRRMNAHLGGWELR